MYRVLIKEDAVLDIERLDKSMSRRITKKISWLAENALSIKPDGLHGKLSRFSKLRYGDYRIIYEIIHTKKLVIIHLVGHRSDVYKPE